MQTLGCSLLPAQARRSIPFIFDFSLFLPQGVTFSRADAIDCATYRTSQGKLTLAGANMPRIDHSITGLALGLLVEGARTNKLALSNASPLSTAGISVVSGQASLSIINDAEFLTLVGLEVTGNGSVVRINNTGQNTQAVISFSNSFGNLNPHSFSIWARCATGIPVLTRSGNAPQNLLMEKGNLYSRYKLENITGHAAMDKILIQVPTGADLYIILYQLEEGAFSSSEIITTGAPATRALDRPRVTGLGLMKWWRSDENRISAFYRPYVLGLGNVDQYIFQAHDGTVNNCIGMRINRSADKDLSLNIRSGSVLSVPGASNLPHIENGKHSAFMRWNADEILSWQGGVSKKSVPAFAMPGSLTEFSVGSRNGGSDPLWGWIERIEFNSEAACASSDRLVFGAGQSLMKGLFYSQETGKASGRDAFRAALAIHEPNRQCIFADGATGGSAASKTSDSTKFWWDVSSSSRGPVFDEFYDAIEEAAYTPNIILWSQGEADSHFIGSATSREIYKSCLQNIFEDMRNTLGDIQILIQPIGRRSPQSGYSNWGGIQEIRDIQKEICNENSDFCRFGGESYDLPLYDDVHLTDEGYIALAMRHAEAIANTGQGGPSILSVARIGDKITVNLAYGHDADDFQPAINISGFYFTSDGEKISILSATKQGPDKVELQLAAEPIGNAVEVLYYGYDAMKDINLNAIIKDNSPLSRPLKTCKVIL